MLNSIILACDWKLNVFSGSDEFLLPALIMGVDGAIGVTYNPLIELYVGI